jgi:uncharacterized protein YbgA (DUF1722 family)
MIYSKNKNIKLMNKDFERVMNQSIDILIYDYNNKYQLLKKEKLDKNTIDNIMSDYQKTRIKEFIQNYNDIKKIFI